MNNAAKIQGVDQVVDISDWELDEESGEAFPEGSREKKLCRAPNNETCDFIIPNHRYLFKESSHRYPEQFWAEIIAYKIGILIGVEVPPAFVAIDKEANKTGALIEWFINYPGSKPEVKIPGVSYMQLLIKDYDIKKGEQHNFQSIKALHLALRRRHSWGINWLEYWAKTLTFDTLIGNTDRHQDNWGIIWEYENNSVTLSRMTPVFDNGTSMGHEIVQKKFKDFNKEEKIRKYVLKGCHHMKWALDDQTNLNQVDFLQRLITEHSETRDIVAVLMKFDISKLENDIMELTKFKVPCPLSSERAKFIINLLGFRKKRIMSILGD